MSLVVMIVTACLGSACRDYPVPLDASMQVCAQLGQMQLAQWSADHPALRILGWRCSDRPEKAA